MLHQVLDFAVEDEYLRINPSDNALKELKQTHNLDSERRKGSDRRPAEAVDGLLEKQ